MSNPKSHESELSSNLEHVEQLNQRIAICSSGEVFGGVERHILGILSGLQMHGLSSLLLLFYDNELAGQARKRGIETIIIKNFNLSLLSTSRYLAHIFEKYKIKIVHAHGYKAAFFCALARCWFSFKMVKTEHGLPEPMSGRPIAELRNKAYYFLDTIATQITNATVCYVTEELSESCKFAHSGLQFKVIPNGIESPSRCKLSYPVEFNKNQFNLAIIGRLDTVKGHDLAIRAIANENLLSNIHLYIIGVGPCELNLKLLADANGVAKRVHFLGFKSNIYDYVAHCDVLLMPSLHEGLPYTLLEAMALGIPIIASRVGGLAEILKNDINALLITPGNIEEITQAIIRLHNSPTLCRYLGENAQQLQKKHYSLEIMILRYLKIYMALLYKSEGFPS
ncbi:MAG TPA: glycosyltransferase family 4 protein [Candidatus Competibacter sp.]|nr:glycosyltransferase family 4 protein [Candidatus Competibacter sp.]